MMRSRSVWRWALVAGLVVGAQAGGLEVPRAQESPAVTLEASRTRMTYGERVVLSGRIALEVADETVSIVDEADNVVVKTTTTDDAGRYSVSLRPRSRTSVHARWNENRSDEITLRVRPRLRVRLRRVRLFDRVLVTGSLAPAHPGDGVTVELYRWGKRVGRKTPALREGRYFRASFHLARPGRYRARVVFDDDDHLQAARKSVRRTTPLPSLSIGARNVFVKLLERRLSSLRYHLKRVDRRFRRDTADALRAFNKVQGRARLGSVDASTWRALVDPTRPRPRRASPHRHIEVDQTKQVLYKVVGGNVRAILHVSTGRNGYTHDGTYRVHRKLAGYSPGRLYYPSYFDGLRAIHGWRQVPTYPASHGCVRVPMWAAKWIYGFADVGRRVIVYH
jgi:N-acetylmuramoyl-L-alanine amidase